MSEAIFELEQNGKRLFVSKENVLICLQIGALKGVIPPLPEWWVEENIPEDLRVTCEEVEGDE